MVGPERGKQRGSDESVLVRLGNAAWLVLAVIAFNLKRSVSPSQGRPGDLRSRCLKTGPV